ncbi:MAG: glycoside hydrolase family 16 protein [Acidimicrobiales bacterium]
MKFALQVVGVFIFTLLVASFALRASGQSGAGSLYLSSTSGATIGGVTFTDEDIVVLNTSTGLWSMHIDGSDLGIRGSQKIDGFHVRPDGSVLFSITLPASLDTLGVVDDSDVIEFIPTSTGTDTAGTMSVYFDGSAHGLTGNGEDVDAVALDEFGNLLISTSGRSTVGFGVADDEDVMLFDGSTLSLFLDGSAVGLAAAAEDVVGISAVPGGAVRLSVLGNYSVTGASGDRADIFECAPVEVGPITDCAWANFWDGSANGFQNESLNAFTASASVVPPPTTTTTTMATTTTTASSTTTTEPVEPPPVIEQALFVTSSSSGRAGGVAFTDEDILKVDSLTGEWELYLDGSDLGIGGSQKIDAFDVRPDGSVLFSLLLAANLAGVGPVDDSDIVKFVPTSVGPDTAGSLSMFFDGSSHQLTTGGEDIDALALDDDGRLLISVSGVASGGFGSAADEDILIFDGSTLSMYLDGSTVGLTTAAENIAGISTAGDGILQLATVGSYNVPGAIGTRSDALQCVPILAANGSIAECSWSNYWNGLAAGFRTENINGISAAGAINYFNDFSRPLGSDWTLYNSVGHAGWGLRRPSAITIESDPSAMGEKLLTITAEMGSGSESGLMVSGGLKLKLPQTYGRYTFRMKSDPDPDQVTSAVGLLWPESNQWPRDGEINIVETYGSRATREPIESVLHWLNPNAQEPYTILDDAKAIFTHPGVSSAQWHTYQLEWRADLVSVSVDGGTPLVLSTNPAEIADWNMELALQLDGFDAPDTPGQQPVVSGPVTMSVDYVLVQP